MERERESKRHSDGTENYNERQNRKTHGETKRENQAEMLRPYISLIYLRRMSDQALHVL